MFAIFYDGKKILFQSFIKQTCFYYCWAEDYEDTQSLLLSASLILLVVGADDVILSRLKFFLFQNYFHLDKQDDYFELWACFFFNLLWEIQFGRCQRLLGGSIFYAKH